ncbi:MAG: hypothetical protein LH679_16790, partial [Cyanobacteria bacterium CAN_BIN43]|nr:hypothetical protein [Cyanobacteria bacterium CAN_BIN43]
MASVRGLKDSKSVLLAENNCLMQNSTLIQEEILGAIAALIIPLLPQNMMIRVARKGDRLGVLLEAIGVPDRAQA